MLAQTGNHFYVIEVEKGGVYGWQTNMRPVPENVTVVEESAGLEKLQRREFDLAVCHNVKDVLKIQDLNIPKIWIFHCGISAELALGGNRFSREQYRNTIRELMARSPIALVFISQSKREDCGLDGTVILPGIDLGDYRDYRGEVEKVLRVGNLMKERDLVLRDFSRQEEILGGIPSTLLGINPTVPGSRVSKSWEDLKDHYRSHRLFLNSTLHPWEDGYNLAMLEAMGTGMPVVSFANPTAPIVDGVNGYISEDTRNLRQRVEELLSHRERAIELGLEGRKTVAKQFPMERFVENWNALFERVMDHSPKGRIARSPTRKSRRHRKCKKDMKKNILLCYTSHPATTGRYYEKSLRKHHNVLTCGPCLTPEIIRAWDLGDMKEKPKKHDLDFPYPGPVDFRTVLENLGDSWYPDLFLWIETGIDFPLQGLESLDCPKACYLIDTHLKLEKHLQWAAQFDVIFLAQRAYIPEFNKAGTNNVFWLPLACDPEIHGKVRVKKRYDIGFVGSITPGNPRRIALLDRLSKRFDVHIERCFLKEMTRVFSASKMVFNNSVRDDLNMRVFEALCSGSLLLTDRARGSGIEELFQVGGDLVIYDDENLEELARYYLEHVDEREAIAARGRQEVLRKHTYDRRAQEMMAIVEGLTESGVFNKPQGDYYCRERPRVVGKVPREAKRILDVGCATGLVGKELKEIGAEEVIGIEKNPRVAREAESNLDQVWVSDVETFVPPWPEGYFDAIIFADILEHLVDPAKTIRKLARHLNPNGIVIASIPNVRFWAVIKHLAEGNWTYQDQGILDRTHLRFFTLSEIKRLFASVGLELVDIESNADPRAKEFLGRSYPVRLQFGQISIEVNSEEEMKDFFVFQYIVSARQRKAPEILQHNRQSALSLTEQAEELEQTGCLVQAKDRYLDRLEKTPSDEEALLGLGRISMQMGQWEEAESYLKRAVNGEHQWEALVLLARCTMKSGKLTETLAHLERARNQDGQDSSRQTEVLNLMGDCLAQMGEYDEAEASYRKAIDIEARADEAWTGLGVLDVLKGEYLRAEEAFTKAADINPKNDKTFCGLGIALWNGGQKERAFENFQKSLDINPENLTSLNHLLTCSYENGKFEVTEEYLKQYLDLHPLNLDVLYSLGDLYYQLRRYDEVREVVETILMFQPDHDPAKELATLISHKTGTDDQTSRQPELPCGAGVQR